MEWNCVHCGCPIYWDFATDRYRHEHSKQQYCDDSKGKAELKVESRWGNGD